MGRYDDILRRAGLDVASDPLATAEPRRRTTRYGGILSKYGVDLEDSDSGAGSYYDDLERTTRAAEEPEPLAPRRKLTPLEAVGGAAGVMQRQAQTFPAAEEALARLHAEDEQNKGLLERGATKIAHVFGAPARGLDALARTVARAEGIPVGEETTRAQMLRAALGYAPGTEDEGAPTPPEVPFGDFSAAKGIPQTEGERAIAETVRPYQHALVGRGIEEVANVALDPLTYIMGGAGRVAGAGRKAELAGRAASAALAPGMAVGAGEAIAEAAKRYAEEGLTPETAEAAVGTLLPAGFALGAGTHAVAEAPVRPRAPEPVAFREAPPRVRRAERPSRFIPPEEPPAAPPPGPAAPRPPQGPAAPEAPATWFRTREFAPEEPLFEPARFFPEEPFAEAPRPEVRPEPVAPPPPARPEPPPTPAIETEPLFIPEEVLFFPEVEQAARRRRAAEPPAPRPRPIETRVAFPEIEIPAEAPAPAAPRATIPEGQGGLSFEAAAEPLAPRGEPRPTILDEPFEVRAEGDALFGAFRRFVESKGLNFEELRASATPEQLSRLSEEFAAEQAGGAPAEPLAPEPPRERAPAAEAAPAGPSREEIVKAAREAAQSGKFPAYTDAWPEPARAELANRGPALITGQDFWDQYREEYGGNPQPDGIQTVKLPGEGNYDVIQWHKGEIWGGAPIRNGRLNYIFGGKAYDSPVSAGPIFAEVDRLGAKREATESTAVSAWAKEARAKWEARRERGRPDAGEAGEAAEGAGPTPGVPRGVRASPEAAPAAAAVGPAGREGELAPPRRQARATREEIEEIERRFEESVPAQEANQNFWGDFEYRERGLGYQPPFRTEDEFMQAVRKGYYGDVKETNSGPVVTRFRDRRPVSRRRGGPPNDENAETEYNWYVNEGLKAVPDPQRRGGLSDVLSEEVASYDRLRERFGPHSRATIVKAIKSQKGPVWNEILARLREETAADTAAEAAEWEARRMDPDEWEERLDREQYAVARRPEPTKQELEKLAANEKNLGAVYVEDAYEGEGATMIRRNGREASATICTNVAHAIQDALGPKRVKVMGFEFQDNPTVSKGLFATDGHDFAVVDGRYIVDPWMRDTANLTERVVFDLQDPRDAAAIKQFYGDTKRWKELSIKNPFRSGRRTVPDVPNTPANRIDGRKVDAEEIEEKYAVARPGQRGLPGIGEDVAKPEERPKAPRQTSMFGGEMLQGVERKVPEGREGEGPLFQQEARAAEAADRKKQGEMFATAPGPLGLYSQLERAAQKIPQAMTGHDMLRYLSDPKRGVKADEMKWTGLDDYLKARGKEKVTPQEVREFVESNRVEVQEVTKGSGPIHRFGTPEQQAAATARLDAARAALNRGDVQAPDWRARVEEHRAAEAAMRDIVPGWGRAEGDRTGPAKFAHYRLPGGENYREVLLTLPRLPRSRETPWLGKPTTVELADYGYKVFDEKGNAYGVYSARSEADALRLAGERGPTDFAWEGRERPSARDFTSGHWDEPNVLAHVRLTDRVDADGKRVLFVEEIQSDWAQKGRKYGFTQPRKAPPEPLVQLPERYRVERVDDFGDTPQFAVVRADAAGRLLRVGQLRSTPEDAQAAFLNEWNEQARFEAAHVDQKNPRAPFVESTEGWTNLALKRVLRMAAEEGYDRVAWTTGEQQAARYDLRKHIDSLQWRRNENGSYDVIGNKGMHEVVRKEDVSADALADVVGKELADKIVASENADLWGYRKNGKRAQVSYGSKESAESVARDMGGTAEPIRGTFSGLDLKVGGEGMKGYYDEIVPAAINKLAKKWGAKTGETLIFPGDDIGGPLEAARLRKALPEDADVEARPWATVAGNKIAKRYATREEASRGLDRGEGDHLINLVRPNTEGRVGVHSIDVTPEMRRSVMEEGQPLFRAGEPSKGGRPVDVTLLKQAGLDLDWRPDPKGGFRAPLKDGGELRVDPRGDFTRLNPAALEASRKAGGTGEEALPVGSFRRIGKDALIKLAEGAPEGTAGHEALHFVSEFALSDKEYASMLKRYGDEESAAYALSEWTKSGRKTPNSWFSKIVAFAKRLVHRFRPTWESTFEEIASGRAARRAAAREGEVGGERYATAAPAQPGQPAPRFAPEESAGFKERWLDQYHFLQLIENRLRGAGRAVPETLETPSIAAAISRSRKADAQRRIDEGVAIPITDKLRKTGISAQDFSDYLYARHTVDPVTRATYQQRGARGETGMTQQRAQQILQAAQRDPAKLRAMNESADILYRAVREARQALVEAGVKSQRAVDFWQTQWGDHWVSLPHNVDPQGNPAAYRTGKGFQARGKIKARTGATTEAFDPFAATLASVEKMWMDAENNRVARSFWRIRRQNPELRTIVNEVTPPMTPSLDARTGRVVNRPNPFGLKNDPQVSEVWIDGEQKWLKWENPEHAAIVKNMNSQQVDALGNIVQKGTRWITRATTRDNIVFSAVVNPIKDVQEAVFNAGVEYGPKVAKELVTNYPSSFGAVGRVIAGADLSRLSPQKRALAQEFEQYRRDGGKLGNFQFRDLASRADQLAKMAQEPGRTEKAVKALPHLYIKATELSMDVTEAAVRFSFYRVMKDRIQTQLIRQGRTRAQAAEQAHAKAIMAARDLTLDFERTGASPVLKSLKNYYSFFNAAVQGPYKLARVAASNPKAFAGAVGGLMLVGALNDMANRAMAGDSDKDGRNDYDALPQWEKENYFFLPIWRDGKATKIPLPRQAGFFYGLGMNLSQGAHKAVAPGAMTWNMAMGLNSLLNPFGEGISSAGSGEAIPGIALTAMPTVLKPLAEVAMNQRVLGGPVRPSQPPKPTPPRPKSELYFKSVNPFAKWLMQTLNKATGGDKVVPGWFNILSPEDVEQLATGYAGGLGRTVSQAVSTAWSLGKGELPSPRDVPVLSRFAYTPHPSDQSRTYREYKDEITKTTGIRKNYLRDAQAAERAGNRTAAREMRAKADKYQTLAGMSNVLSATDRELERLYDAREAAEAAKRDTKMLDASIEAAYRRANRRIAEARKRAGLPMQP